MDERFCRVGDLELCYQEFGDAADPAMLLIMGLGTQMIAWPDEFCARLADRGLRVIRYDNRDIGRSTHLTHARTPTLPQLLRRDPRAAAYTLDDMADDAAGLLDGLGIDSAHIVGASMGGMIAQLVAIRHPQRTRSLASIMSSTGHRLKGQPALRVYPFFARRPPQEREAAIERTAALFRIVGSTGYDEIEADLRDVAARSWDRAAGDGRGTARQLAAIMAATDRAPDLAAVRAPTLVIHGTRDRMVRPSGGRATAAAIPGARLLLIEGMGHDLPRRAWPRIVDALVDNAGRADTPAPTKAGTA
jgi:pimeloyl-ACP methyl ester carboxylesterase